MKQRSTRSEECLNLSVTQSRRESRDHYTELGLLGINDVASRRRSSIGILNNTSNRAVYYACATASSRHNIERIHSARRISNIKIKKFTPTADKRITPSSQKDIVQHTVNAVKEQKTNVLSSFRKQQNLRR